MDMINIDFNTCVATVVFGIVLSFFLYKFSTRNHDYWEKRGVPFAKPYPVLGSLWSVIGKKIEDVELDRYKKFGRLYGSFEGSTPGITIAEPELLRLILVKDFHYFTDRRVIETNDAIADKMMPTLRGEDWKRVRAIVSPTFTTGKIKRVMSIFADCSKTVIQNFKIASAAGPVDALSMYGAFTMDVIASAAFSTKIDSHNDPENTFVKKAKAAFSQFISLKFILFFLIPGVLKKLRVNVIAPETNQFFKKVTLEIIAERKKTEQTRNDFLQMLIDIANEVASEEKSEDKDKFEDITANYGDDSLNHSVFKDFSTSKHLSMDELVAQCVIFFLAGYHTTATSLGLVTHNLAVHQDMQDKVFQEMIDVLTETDGELTYESVQKMKYLDNVISETLRMHSPAIRLERTCEADYKLGDTGLTIPKGTVVGVPVYAMHRDPSLFPDPERFNPDRFSIEEKDKIIPYSYIPFGAGPRNCVGMRFALMELKMCLVYVFCTFHVKRCPETKVPPEFESGISAALRAKEIIVKFEARKNCPLKS